MVGYPGPGTTTSACPDRHLDGGSRAGTGRWARVHRPNWRGEIVVFRAVAIRSEEFRENLEWHHFPGVVRPLQEWLQLIGELAARGYHPELSKRLLVDWQRPSIEQARHRLYHKRGCGK